MFKADKDPGQAHPSTHRLLPHFSSDPSNVVSNLQYHSTNIKMKLAIASLVLGSAAAFQPYSALNAVPKSSSALDMKVRFPLFSNMPTNACITAGSSTRTSKTRKHELRSNFRSSWPSPTKARYLCHSSSSKCMLGVKAAHLVPLGNRRMP